MTDTLEILQKAQELIRDPEKWVRGSYAATKNNKRTFIQDAKATGFCSYGALAKVQGLDIESSRQSKGANILRLAAEPSLVVDINDNGTHADVMAMFDKAIALAKNEGE